MAKILDETALSKIIGSWTEPIPVQTETGQELCKKITNLLESNTRYFGGYYETFTKALDLMYYALKGPEEKYMSLVKELDPAAVRIVANIMHMLIDAFYYRCVYNDYLGVVYESLSQHDKRMGQFFTPWPLAYMMAQITLGDVKAQIENAKQEKKKITMNEPAVGAGVMFLAAKRVIIEQAGLQGLDYFEFSGQDINHTCVRMCEIQMMLTDYRFMASRLLLAATQIAERKKALETEIAVQKHG